MRIYRRISVFWQVWFSLLLFVPIIDSFLSKFSFYWSGFVNGHNLPANADVLFSSPCCVEDD